MQQAPNSAAEACKLSSKQIRIEEEKKLRVLL
jgi:hypothetical protein